jgi:hypothetical protein
VPVPAQVGRVEGHDHQMARAEGDVLVAARAQVRLDRLERVDPADLDLVSRRAYLGINAHSRRASITATAAATNT